MLNSQTITQWIAVPPTPTLAGKVAFVARGLRNDRHSSRPVPQSHVQFAADLAKTLTDTPQAAKYVHPGEDPAVGAARPVTGLSPADLAWLDRLPRDPAEMTYDDAVAVAAMHASLSSMTSPSDKRLVESVYRPVAELHDAAQAGTVLAQASAPLPPVPSSALPALTDAVAAEAPALTPEESVARASRLLGDALAARQAARDAKLAQAEAVVSQAQAATAARLAVRRPLVTAPVPGRQRPSVADGAAIYKQRSAKRP